LFFVAVVLAITAVVFLISEVGSSRSLSPARSAAPGAQSGAKLKPPPAPRDPKTDRDRLIAAAYSYLGAPYKYGGKTPEALDCSGFTKLAYAGASVKLPDGSYNQAQGEKPLTSVDQLRPGDLIFYRFKPDAGVTHITMYRGDGWIIGTGTPGQQLEVCLYPASDDLTHKDWTLTYRHITLPDEQQ